MIYPWVFLASRSQTQPRDVLAGNWIRKKLDEGSSAAGPQDRLSVLFPHSLSGTEGCRQ